MSSWFQAGGPAQYNQACKLSRKLFVDKFNFYLELWDLIGYDYSWSQLHLAGPKNGKVKVITAGESLVRDQATAGFETCTASITMRGKYESKRNQKR